MLRAFGHRVAMCCDMLGVVGPNLKMVKFEPTTPNMSQHGGQTHATCCAQQCCDMLCWHVAIVWPGLKHTYRPMRARVVAPLFYKIRQCLLWDSLSSDNYNASVCVRWVCVQTFFDPLSAKLCMLTNFRVLWKSPYSKKFSILSRYFFSLQFTVVFVHLAFICRLGYFCSKSSMSRWCYKSCSEYPGWYFNSHFKKAHEET